MNRRGGYRQPQGPRPPSGPGRFSQRDEGTQPIRSPDLDEPGMQYGQREELEAGQRIAPIPQGGTPRPAQRPRISSPPVDGNLPSFLSELPTNRPNEPETAGLPMGPGPGPEVLPDPVDYREAILDYLQRRYSNADAANMLAEMRRAREPQPMPLQEPMVPPIQDDGFEDDILPGDSPLPLMGDTGDPSLEEELAEEPSLEGGEEIPMEELPPEEGGEEAPPAEGTTGA